MSSQNENKATMRVALFQMESPIMCLLQISGCTVGSIKSPSNRYEGVILIWKYYPYHDLCFCAGVPEYKLLTFLKSTLNEAKKKITVIKIERLKYHLFLKKSIRN